MFVKGVEWCSPKQYICSVMSKKRKPDAGVEEVARIWFMDLND
jgi:hypothetical protein